MNSASLRRLAAALICLVIGARELSAAEALPTQASPARLALRKGDHVVIVGNTLAERMQYFGWFETLLHARFSDHNLVVRNLGWSADEINLRPRSKDFADHGHRLADHKPN